MKLYSALYNTFYPFKDMKLFDGYEVATWPDQLDTDGCLVVWGGGDISPSLYNKEVSKRTHATAQLSERDALEWELMKEAQHIGIPIIGICRGAQMLCALAGGFLIQDVDNHCEEHKATTRDGRSFNVSSLHHQMLYPFDVEHEIVAWSSKPMGTQYLDVNTPVVMPLEPELVNFPQLKGIGIQWHPEYMDVNTPANVYVKEQLKGMLNGF